MALLGFLGVGLGGVTAVYVVRKTARTERDLFQQRDRAEVTLYSIADAVITTDMHGRVEHMNPIAESLCGWTLAQARNHELRSVFRVIDERTRQALNHPAYGMALDSHAVGISSRTLLLSQDGRELAIEDSVAPIHDGKGMAVGLVLVFRDVTESRSQARQLLWQASHDPLTGLTNRREFEVRLERLLESAHAEDAAHALLYMDIDQFKIVNDTCGHAAGDELLRQLTVLLQESLQMTPTTLARLGGDEFGILIERSPLDEAYLVAMRLLETVQGFRFAWDDKRFAIGASIGMVAVDKSSRDIGSLLSAVDTACYRAKDKGRNRIQIFRHDDVELAQVHLEMEWVARISKAFEEDRLRLYYQMIVPVALRDLNQGEHYEILLRMIGEDGELISPGAFLPAAERYNLMPTIDRWVIRTLFSSYHRIAVNAPDSCLDTISINLSGASIIDEFFLDFIREQFTFYKVPPCVICFEITETVAIGNLQSASAFIGELKRLGCRFALDDFGSGMSSFTYLKHLDIDYLKIDGTFVRDMVNDSVDFAMVEAINRVGHVMGIETVAEFVENDAIFAKLLELGVDFAQGYGIHKTEPLRVMGIKGVV